MITLSAFLTKYCAVHFVFSNEPILDRQLYKNIEFVYAFSILVLFFEHNIFSF